MIFFPQPVKGFQTKLATEFESGNSKYKGQMKVNSLFCIAAATSEKNYERSSWNQNFYLMKKCIIPLFIV